MKVELQNLAALRQKADYEPLMDITPKEVNDAPPYGKNLQPSEIRLSYFFYNPKILQPPVNIDNSNLENIFPILRVKYEKPH